MQLVLIVPCCGTQAGPVAAALWGGSQCRDGSQGAVLGGLSPTLRTGGLSQGPQGMVDGFPVLFLLHQLLPFNPRLEELHAQGSDTTRG